MDQSKEKTVTEQPTIGDTPAARRAARISAAKALVKANRRLGRETDPAIATLADAGSRAGQFRVGVQDGRRAAS